MIINDNGCIWLLCFCRFYLRHLVQAFRVDLALSPTTPSRHQMQHWPGWMGAGPRKGKESEGRGRKAWTSQIVPRTESKDAVQVASQKFKKCMEMFILLFWLQYSDYRHQRFHFLTECLWRVIHTFLAGRFFSVLWYIVSTCGILPPFESWTRERAQHAFGHDAEAVLVQPTYQCVVCLQKGNQGREAGHGQTWSDMARRGWNRWRLANLQCAMSSTCVNLKKREECIYGFIHIPELEPQKTIYRRWKICSLLILLGVISVLDSMYSSHILCLSSNANHIIL